MRIFLLFVLFVSPLCFSKDEILTAKQLFVSPKYNSISVSPNGRVVAGIQNTNDFKRIFIYDLDDPKGALRSVLKLEDKLTVGSYFWLKDDLIYVNYNSRRGRPTYMHGFVFLNRESGKLNVELKSFKSGGYLFSDFNKEDDKLYFYRYTSKKPYKELYHLSLNDLLNEKFTKNNIFPNQLKDSVYYQSAGPGKLFSVVYSEKNETVGVWHLGDPKSQWKKLLQFGAGDFNLYPVGLLPGDKLAVLTNRDSDRVGLYEFDIQKQKLGRLIYEHPKYDLIDAVYDFEKSVVSSVKFYDHGRLTYEYLEEEGKALAEKQAKVFEGKQTVSIANSINSNVRVVGVFDSRSPTKLFHYDEEADKATKLFSLWPTLGKHKFSETRVFHVNNSSGQDVEAFLTIPDAGKINNNILIVNPHGGPIGIRDHNDFDPETQFYTERGFSVLKVNFRGSSGYGKQFLEAGVGEFGEAIESDISQVVDKVLSEYKFKKLCAMGTSYGAYSSLMLAINARHKYDCVVAKFGVYDLPLLYNETSIKTSEEYRNFVAEVVGPMKSSLYNRSPVYLAHKINIPILLVAGEDDKIAIMEHSKRLEYVLTKHNKNFETLYYKNVGHGHSNWVGEQHQALYVVDFLGRVLGLDFSKTKEADSARLEQYQTIASFFDGSGWVEKDLSKAVEYYSKAADMDDVPSMVRLGGIYESQLFEGELAHDWYSKASNQGSWNATLKLAHMEQRHEPSNRESYTLYLKAKDQGAGYLAEIGIAAEQCLGKRVGKDFDSCYKTFDFNGKLDKSDNAGAVRRLRDAQYVRILEEGALSKTEIEKFISLLEIRKELTFYPVSLSDMTSGSFKTRLFGSPEKLKEGENIDWVSGGVFGMEFKPKYLVKPDKSKKLGLIFKWEKTIGEAVVFTDIYFARRDVGNKWFIVRDFDGEHEKGSVWRVKVLNLDGKLLYSSKFNIN